MSLASNVCLATYNLEVADEHWQPKMSAPTFYCSAQAGNGETPKRVL